MEPNSEMNCSRAIVVDGEAEKIKGLVFFKRFLKEVERRICHTVLSESEREVCQV